MLKEKAGSAPETFGGLQKAQGGGKGRGRVVSKKARLGELIRMRLRRRVEPKESTATPVFKEAKNFDHEKEVWVP